VVAPMRVNLFSGKFMVLACRPLSTVKSTLNSSIAGYINSSTCMLSRCISSMKRTSPVLMLLSSPITSPCLTRAGPEVALIFAFISFATTFARVVFPSPGGPCRRMCSNGSFLCVAAFMAMESFSLTFSWPIHSSRVFGLSERLKFSSFSFRDFPVMILSIAIC